MPKRIQLSNPISLVGGGTRSRLWSLESFFEGNSDDLGWGWCRTIISAFVGLLD